MATAVGIAVALPAVAAYNYFQRRIAVLMDDAETLSTLLMAYLTSDPSAPERLEAEAPEAEPEEGDARVSVRAPRRHSAGAA